MSFLVQCSYCCFVTNFFRCLVFPISFPISVIRCYTITFVIKCYQYVSSLCVTNFHSCLGGHIVIVTRAAHVTNVEQYRDKLEPLMDKLEREGKWKKVERTIFKGFFLDKEGILWKYQVC